MSYSILTNIIILLSLTLIIGVIFRALHLPQVLGYLIIGAVVGPHGLGWVKNINAAHQLAGFGVVFLMFTVGLEFSLAKMRALHKAVILLGGSQVIICSGIGLLIGLLLHQPWYVGLIVGGILSMSSTAITVKQLNDQLELNSSHGRNAIGILLFQDLAVIPFFILIGSLGFVTQQPNITYTLLMTLIKGILALVVILAIGRWVFRPLFHLIASTHVIELFTLAALLVTLASAWLTESLGLSFALGGFLAGMMLSETQFRHQIEIEIRPFRDVLLALFFITIGMLLNIFSWGINWRWILMLFTATILIKSVTIGLLSRLLGDDSTTAKRTALALAQGGEFGFALLTLSLTNRLFPPNYGQSLLGALFLSFLVGPLLITYNKQIAELFSPKKTAIAYKEAIEELGEMTHPIKNHVVLCGYGRIGQNIARLLEMEKIAYLALDLDAEHIREARLAGTPVIYGDASHPELLKRAGISAAKALVISFDDPHAALKILQHAQNTNPKLPILVRCKDEADLSQLQGHGASQIVVEAHEESLMLSYYLLRSLRVPRRKISRLIENIRKEHYDVLDQVFPGSFTGILAEEGIPVKQLRPIVILKESAAVDRSLGDLINYLHEVKAIALRRGKEYHPYPSSHFKLQPNDVLILYGISEDLEEAEKVFLSPPFSNK